MDLSSTLIGALAGLLIERTFKATSKLIAYVLARRRWTIANRSWSSYNGLISDFELIQAGWRNGEFAEGDIAVTIEGELVLADTFADILAARTPAWLATNQKDNPQVGVHFVDPHRLSDTPGEKTHLLLLRGHRFKYFQFLATNRLLLSRDGTDRDLAMQVAGEPMWAKPVPGFANPVSVGLTLFCEGGRYLVLTHRGDLPSSGGEWFPGLKFNAVGETINPRDVVANKIDGLDSVSPWNTARRGLAEEMGFSASDIHATSLVLHSLIFDRRIRDYKVFGYAITKLARSEVEARWQLAPDKTEAHNLWFCDVSSPKQRQQVVKDITDNRAHWTAEAAFCTLSAFARLGWLRPHSLPS